MNQRVTFCRLNLDEWINDPPSSSSSESEDEQYEDEDAPNIFLKCNQEKEENRYEPSEEDLEKVNKSAENVSFLIKSVFTKLAAITLLRDFQCFTRILTHHCVTFQLREARRLEQENNPHYLKPDNSKKSVDNNAVVNNVGHIPNRIPGNPLESAYFRSSRL